MGCIHIASELKWTQNAREGQQRRGIIRLKERDGRKSSGRGSKPELDAPINCAADILCDVLEAKEVDMGRLFGKLGQSGDGIANIWASRDVGIQQFAKKHTVAKSHFGLKCISIAGVFDRTSGITNGRNIGRREWFSQMGTRLAFSECRSFPSMGAKRHFM